MDNEKILLEELNKLGNFTNVKEEFNNGQLNAIYGAMKQVKNNVVLADVSNFVCPECKGDNMVESNKREVWCNDCEKNYRENDC